MPQLRVVLVAIVTLHANSWLLVYVILIILTDSVHRLVLTHNIHYNTICKDEIKFSNNLNIYIHLYDTIQYNILKMYIQ
jgi:hypothetical protein